MEKYLIVNADDFGIHSAVNHAVYKAFHEGFLTSTSIIAGGKAFEEAVDLAKKMPGIGIGVHLTLVGSIPGVMPAEEIPSLTWEDGVLCQNYMKLILRDLQGKIELDDVYREWDAQIQKVLSTGLSITQVDGHQHMHMWSRFTPIAIELCKKYDIPCMRVSDEKFFFGFNGKNMIRSFAGTGLSLMSRLHRPMLKKNGIKTNDHFYGMLYGGHFSEERMYHVVTRIPEGVTEFMCHPANNEKSMEDTFHWGYHGEWELKALLSHKIKDMVKEKHIKLISYRELNQLGVIDED